ncbi:MAG TPA: glycoside hydrolase domain-containing protein [Flavitalea sp.]|nr:glycoside hydrolase domain-containing protein [Flavitalea sp.]
MLVRLLFISFLLIPPFLNAQVKSIWVVSDGEKVNRESLNHPSKKGNLIWEGSKVKLKGLYNEVLAFQLIVESGNDSVKNLEVTVDAPVDKNRGNVIGGSSLKYGPSGTIEIFSEHYLHVTDSTPPDWHYGSPAAFNRPMTGWIPDALIPGDALPGRGGFPIDMGPLNNQAFWIDVHLPRDQKRFAATVYTGNVSLIAAGKTIQNIPLEVTLVPNYLPDDNRQNVWMYSSDVYEYYPSMSHDQVDEMIKFEAHRHRIDMVGGFSVNKDPFVDSSMAKYKPYLDGSAFTPENGYYGAGAGIGEKLFPVGMYSSPVLGETKEEVQKQSDLWVNWFNKSSPSTRYFWYIIDEPRKDKHEWIRERANWVKKNPGPGRSLPIFTTTHYQKEIDDVIDIFAAFDGVNLEDLPVARMNGGDHWFYNGNRPRIGSLILEGSAVDFRVSPWLLYKYGINTWFIWHGTQWRHNMQGPKKHLHQNVFQNPLTFINDDLEIANGEGVIVYPGHMPFYPEEDRGLNRIITSIRFKNIRRGQQDAALMYMAEQKIGRSKVIEMISKVVPKALSEVSMKDATQWSEKGDDYDKVREALMKVL